MHNLPDIHLDDLSTADDWCQRLKENPPEPELTPEEIEEIKADHEAFLTDLEAAAVKAIALCDWDDVQSCIHYYNPETKDYGV